MDKYYDWIKAFHLVAVISWMVGLFYLPRLFVYHCEAKVETDQYKTFIVMEKKLLKIIMLPAMLCTIILGFWLAKIYGFKNLGIWFHIKMTLVIMMLLFHHYLAILRKDFEYHRNKHSSKFYRIINELPTILMISIVLLAIVKPFS